MNVFGGSCRHMYLIPQYYTVKEDNTLQVKEMFSAEITVSLVHDGCP